MLYSYTGLWLIEINNVDFGDRILYGMNIE
jgi:hypothetical protein